MNCKEFLSIQSRYIDGDLEKDAAKKASAHLAECPACHRMHAEMEALVKTLHTMDEVPVPENLTENILAAVKQGPKKEKQVFQLPRFFRSWQLYSVAAACMLIFTVLYSQTGDRLTMTNDAYVYTVAPHAPQKASLPNPPASLPEAPVTEAPTASPALVPSVLQNSHSIFAPAQTRQQTPSVAATENAVSDMASVPSTAQDFSADTSIPAAASETAEAAPFSIISGRLAPAAEKEEKTEAAKAPLVTTPTPSKAPAKTGSTSTPTPKTYAEVSSLVKRSITFIVDDTGAEGVFQSAKSGGASAVRSALYNAGYDFTTRENVVEEYAAQYNALAKEANSLAARIADGEASLRSQLSQKESEMQTLKNTCNSPVLYLAYQ